MSDTSIITIIDKHLQGWIEKGLNALPGKTEPEMTNPNHPIDGEGWQRWYPIDSTVTDSEIEDLENQLNYRLPKSYKIFLKHKHFCELYISEAHFSGQEIRKWRRHLVDMAFDGYPREFLIDKGYIPFAVWSDWGVLCFDTNIKNMDNEYPIVCWDHEHRDDFDPFSTNFHELLLKLDKESADNDS
jgi:hypothetical protein